MQINGRKEERLGRREEKGQILNRSIILTAGFFNFSLSSSLTLRNPLFYGVSCFGIHYDTIIRLQYLTDKKRTNTSNQTAVNILAVCLQKKAREMVSLLRRRQLSIKEAWKAGNRQIKVLIAVSLIFLFARASALVSRLRRSPSTRALDLLWLKRKIGDCSQSVFYKVLLRTHLLL